MPVYIVCHKKRNNPRMDVRICEMKCALKDECREFKNLGKNELTDPAPASSEAEAVGLKAA